MLADLPDLDPAAFDPSAGAAGTRARLLGVETDGRWRHRYVAATSATGLAALLPVYWPAGRSWPDRAYAPEAWPIPGCPPPR